MAKKRKLKSINRSESSKININLLLKIGLNIYKEKGRISADLSLLITFDVKIFKLSICDGSH